MFRPRVFWVTSKTEPARSILFVVATLTFVGQFIALMFDLTWFGFINSSLVFGLALWATWSAQNKSIKHMSLSSFWLFVAWLWSGLARALISPDPFGLMLWFPMLVVAGAMAVIYIYMSAQKKALKPPKVGRDV